MRVPSLRHHRGSGQAVVTIKGRDYYLGKFGSHQTVDKYGLLIREHYGKAADSPLAGPDDSDVLTIIELTAAYRLHTKKALSSGEYGNTKSALRSLEELFPDLLVASFGPKRLMQVREEFVRRALCRSTVNKYTRYLKTMFRWGVQEEIVRADVWKSLDAVRGLRKGATDAPDREKVKPVPADRFNATLPFFSRIVQGLAKTQRGIGCRPGEATRLRPCEIDREGIVTQSGMRFWVWNPGQHKNEWRDQGAAYLIPPEVQSVLKPFLDRNPDAYCFSPREAELERNEAKRAARRTPLYRSHINQQKKRQAKRPRRVLRECYNTSSYRNCVTTACKKAKVARWTPHQLRHLKATEIAAKHGIEQARRALAQRSLDATAIYAERDLKELAEVLSRFARAS